MLVKIISAMLQNTYTTDDFVERLALMRIYYAKRLFSGGDNATLKNVLSDACEIDTIQKIEEWQIAFKKDSISPLVVYEALDAIEEDLTGIPSVTVYVPIRFTLPHVERFGQWFRENVQPNILMTLRVDPRMGGGCGVVWNDTYHDISLRYHIKQKHEQIIAMFNNYTHA